MNNKDLYIYSPNATLIKKSYKNISFTIIAELSEFSNPEIAISLFEDIKTNIMSHYQKDLNHIETTTQFSSEVSKLNINVPQSLYNKLSYRASKENVSLDTLCVYYLSASLTNNFKE